MENDPQKKQLNVSLLTDKLSLTLLSLLKADPSYPRNLSRLLQINETHVSERLKNLEQAGLLTSRWERMTTREVSKNVKRYYFQNKRVVLSFEVGGVEIKAIGNGGQTFNIPLRFYNSEVPIARELIGRSEELRFLSSTSGIRVVWGIPGIGKTTLVSNFASSMEQTPVFWHEVRQVDSLLYLLTKLAVFLNMLGSMELMKLVNRGIHEKRFLMDLAIKTMAKRHALFVLDDVHRCTDSGISELFQLMAEKKINGILISRERLPLSDVKELRLEGLSQVESETLIRTHGRQPSMDLISRTHGHPLLIELACNTRSAGDDYIRNALFENLDAKETSILLPLSVFRGRVNLAAAQYITGQTNSIIIEFVISMEKLGIITRAEREFELHPLIRDIAYSLLQNREQFHKMAAAFYIGRENPQDSLEGLYHLIMGKDYENAIKMLKDYASFIDQGLGEVLLNLILQLPRMESNRLTSWLLLVEGNTMRSLSLGFDQAKKKLGEAIKCAKEAEDSDAEATALNSMGIIYRELDELDQARKYYSEATKVKNLNPALFSRALYNLAEADLQEGNFNRALYEMKKSAKIDLENHNMRGYFISKLNTDYIEFLLGHFSGALKDLRSSTEKLRKPGLSSLIGYYYLYTAYVMIAMNVNITEVLHHMNLALKEFIESGFQFMQAFVISEMILVKVGMRNVDEARADMGKLEGMMVKLEDKEVQANIELAKAVLSMTLGKLSDARMQLENCTILCSKSWALNIRTIALKGFLEILCHDKEKADQYKNAVYKRLVQKGCRVHAERFKMSFKEFEEGNWESIYGILI